MKLPMPMQPQGMVRIVTMFIAPCASVLQVTVLGLIMGSLFFGLKPELTKAPTHFGAAFIMVGGGGCCRRAAHCAALTHQL
jgi:hypothetical protein